MTGGQSRAVRLVVVPAGIALGLAAEWTTLHRPSYALPATAQEQRLVAGDFAVGLALLVCGAVCRRQRPESRVGLLLVATGLAWFLGTFAGSSFASVAAIGALLVALHRAPLVHAVLSYPDGRLSGPIAWVLVAAVYVVSVIADLGQSAGVRIALAVLLAAAAGRAYARSRGPRAAHDSLRSPQRWRLLRCLRRAVSPRWSA